jgi:nucleoid-associated protein YgaU
MCPWAVQIFAVVLAGAAPTFSVRAQSPTIAQPPTIERVVIGDRDGMEFEGEGRAGDTVRLVARDAVIGEAVVGANHRWRIVLRQALAAGTYEIRAEARASELAKPATGDEIRIAIPSSLGKRPIVAYDGVLGSAERATRKRAEELADAANKAADDVTGQLAGRDAAAPSAGSSAAPEIEKGVEPETQSGVSVVVEWLKRSAREYRQGIVDRLAGPNRDVEAADEPEERSGDDTDAAAKAARTIAKERAEAEARRIDLAEADTVRKAQAAAKAAAEAEKKEALRRKQADELARRKAEADKRIAEELERLKKARQEADRAKATPAGPPQKANITLERFYLPGQKRPARDTRKEKAERRIGTAPDEEVSGRAKRVSASGRCAEGRVVHRKGRRWYVTGADDTLWDIAERFYGSGTAYPRIYRVNRKRLSSPHIVRPCLALRLPGRRG